MGKTYAILIIFQSLSIETRQKKCSAEGFPRQQNTPKIFSRKGYYLPEKQYNKQYFATFVMALSDR